MENTSPVMQSSEYELFQVVTVVKIRKGCRECSSSWAKSDIQKSEVLFLFSMKLVTNLEPFINTSTKHKGASSTLLQCHSLPPDLFKTKPTNTTPKPTQYAVFALIDQNNQNFSLHLSNVPEPGIPSLHSSKNEPISACCWEQQHKATLETCPVTSALPYLKYILKCTGVIPAFSSSCYIHGPTTLRHAKKQLFPSHYFQMSTFSLISEPQYTFLNLILSFLIPVSSNYLAQQQIYCVITFANTFLVSAFISERDQSVPNTYS